jgi:hypothetical protein
MQRLLVFGAAILIGFALSLPSHADGLPSCPCPPRAKVKVRTVHHLRHRRLARGPEVYALPGPYDLHALPPSPLDSAYAPAMVAYFRDPSITGYWPGSAAADVEGSASGWVNDTSGDHVERVYYHRTGSPVPRTLLPPPPRIDNFAFRKYEGARVLQYDGVIGEYVPLSAPDAAAAIRVANAKPLPLSLGPPR